MRKILLTILILNVGFLISQTKQADVKVDLWVYYSFEKISLTIKSESDSLNNCKFLIFDSQQKIVKTIDLPKASTLIESTISISDVGLGKYSCLVLKGKQEVYKGEFFKEGIDYYPLTSISIPSDDRKWIFIPSDTKK